MHLTPEARGYAAREILRRAGVSADELGKWLVKVEAQWTTVVAPGSSVCIRFRHTDSPKAGDFRRQTVHAKCSYSHPFGLRSSFQSFRCPGVLIGNSTVALCSKSGRALSSARSICQASCFGP